MNRLNVRLLAAFGIVLILTLLIMWGALLLVLRARPVNIDGDKIDLAAALIDTRDRLFARWQAQQGNNLNRPVVALPPDQVQLALQEQAELHNVDILLLREPDCVLWDTGTGYPRTLNNNISREPFLGRTDSPLPPASNVLFSGQFNNVGGAVQLHVGQPLRLGQDLVLRNWLVPLSQQANALCGSRPTEGFSLLIYKPLPQQTFRSVLSDYSGSGLFLALVQAVVVGMFFALIASFLLVRWIAHPLYDVAQAALRLAQGDYSTRAPIHGPEEIQVVAETFNNMAMRVEFGQQAQRDFLANVSHDLRTPLTSIQGFAQAIAEGVAGADAAKQAAQIIYQEAGRLNRMVNDLLDLARIQAGRLDMMRQAVELDNLVRAVGDSLMLRAHEKNLRLTLQIPTLPRIAGDGDRLAQVFTNLIDNAIKHTPAGGQIWVRGRLDERGGGVIIEIEDTGEGIPSHDLPRIFERFYQVDKSRAKRIGTGLGLAITQEIILAHAGHIWAESDYGQGARFTVWLPQPSHDPRETVVISRRKLEGRP